MNGSEKTTTKLEDIPSYIIICFTLTTLILTVTNTVYMIIIYQSKTMNDPPGWYMIHLSFSDLLLGLSLNLNVYIILFRGDTLPVFCFISALCPVLLSGISMWTLLFLNIDRYIAIVKPYTYVILANKRNVLISFIIIWSINLFLSLNLTIRGPRVMNKFTYQCVTEFESNAFSWLLFIFLTYCGTGISLIFIYMHLFYIAIKKKRINGNNKKALRTLLLLLFFFYLAWTPIIANVVSKSIGKPLKVNQTINVILIIVMYFNGIYNCIIYTVTNKKFKREIYKFFNIKLNDVQDSHSLEQ